MKTKARITKLTLDLEPEIHRELKIAAYRRSLELNRFVSMRELLEPAINAEVRRLSREQ